jgi:hypothetical protein
MKTFLLTAFCVNMLFCQVGIGTNNIESGVILKMESLNQGFLIPKLKLQSKNVKAPLNGVPKTGLLVYNTATNGVAPNQVASGFYYWNETSSGWEPVYKPVIHSIAKYVNVGTTTDFNNGTNALNIFDEGVFNEAPSLYQKYLNGIKIFETGLYKFTLNLDMDGTSDRDIFAIDIYVDNKKIPETFYVSTVDNASGSSQDIGYVFTVYINIPRNNSGSYVYFMGREVDGVAQVYFKNPRTSSVTIEKVR